MLWFYASRLSVQTDISKLPPRQGTEPIDTIYVDDVKGLVIATEIGSDVVDVLATLRRQSRWNAWAALAAAAAAIFQALALLGP
jgi:hypothetical protein